MSDAIDAPEPVPAPPPPNPVRRVYGAGAACVGWLVGAFEPARKLIVNVGIIAGVAIGGPAVYKLATKPNFVIKDIQVPGALSDRGYTGDVVAQQILDHISEIDRIGGSKKEKAAISGFDLDSSMPSIQLPVGGFNLNAVVGEVRQLLGVTETKLTGDIYISVPGDDDKKIPAQYGVRQRLDGKRQLLKGTPPGATGESRTEDAAARTRPPGDPINLGYYFYKLKRYDKAYDTTVTALSDPSDANDPWAYSMRGLIARDQGKFSEAIANIKLAIQKDPKFWMGYVNLSDSYRLMGDLPQAETAARKAVALAPNEQEGHAALALVLLDQGKRDEAIAEAKTGIAADPKDAGGHLTLGRILHKLQRYEEALASFSTSAELSESAEPLINAAGSTKSLKRDDDAYALLKRGTETDPQILDAWNGYGTAALERGDVKAATAAFNKIVALAPRSALGPLKLASIPLKQKRPDQALAVFEKFAASGLKNDPDFLVGWSETLWSLGKKPEAQQKLLAAEDAAGTNVDLHDRIARSLEAAGEIPQAIEVYRRAITLDPKLENLFAAHIARLSARLATPAPAGKGSQAQH